MSESKEKLLDGKISDITDDLPTFVQTKRSEKTSDEFTPEKVDMKDTDENLEKIGGERVEDDTHTLMRMKRGGRLRESLVGMKEGVPGIFSGYERTTRKYSKLSRTDSDKSLDDETKPMRPPRKPRGKSETSENGDTYDRLWTPREREKDEESEHAYSVLGNSEERLYDDVEEGSDDFLKGKEIVLSSSPIKDGWIEDGTRFENNGRKNRPMSTVVLPISPVEGNEDWESDEGEDWGSDFDSVNIPDDEIDNDDDLYEVVGDLSKKVGANRSSVYEDLSAVRARTAAALNTPPSFNKKPLPPLPMKPLPPVPDDSSSLNEQDEETVPYVDIIYDGGDFPTPKLPPLEEYATEEEIKRYQIIKYILENEKMYLTTIHSLIQDYEKPLRKNKIIAQDSIRAIFQHLQEIEQCHQLFNIALVGRMADWNENPAIGDIIYASFSKSMVLKAYTSYVKNFTGAMDRVKETCKSVPAFLSFLRSRLRKSLYKYSFYDLLKRPLGRFPQLVVLLQELLKVTPLCHGDRLPLQMALTHLECLSELICDKRREMEMKYKVSQLDKYFVGLSKPLFSNRRYYIRHDDMFLCKVVDGRVVKTKHQRLFLLSDLLICASIINKANAAKVLAKKRYRVKWCVPVVEVDVVDVGSGIHVNIDNKTTTTIKYTHPVSSPRPGSIDVEQHLEDLQHDMAVIGQIAGLVASLRKSYDIINGAKVSEWYRGVKETLDQELDVANMHWLELSIPTKDKKTTTCLFNLHPPQKKMEWTTELENSKLRLAFDNNPGWYILEDESANIGNMGLLRRNLPLLANKVPLFMVETKFSIERILEITPAGSVKPILWIFSGNDHTGQITLMEMNMSSVPYVIESFVACDSRILAAAAVKSEGNSFADPLEQKTLVWCGTMSGRIHIFNASSEEHEEVTSTKLRDAVLCFKHAQGKVFTGVANGTIACFRRKTDSSWDIDNPVIVPLSSHAVMDMAEAQGRLWCASRNVIHVLDIETLGTEQKIEVGTNARAPVKHLVSYGSGVWASQWKSPKLHLFHNETFECIQSLSVTTPLMRMRSDIDCRIQNINIDKTYVTAMLARGGLLWVGTDNGLVITYPLPRLGGVPQVSGKPCVSFHGHENAVRCLHAFRIERVYKPRRGAKDPGDAIARSLFYVDPFDEAVRGLNIPPYPDLAGSNIPDEEDGDMPTEEPFYFALEPEEGTPAPTKKKTSSSYELWLKSFGENVQKVDPLFSPETLEMEEREGGYNSDESMDSDTEFSFIEDKAKRIPPRVKKDAATFSVEIRQPSGEDSAQQGIVNAKNIPGQMPMIAESDFVEMIGKFEGFELPKDDGDKDSKPENNSSTFSESEFVIVGKTNSGYEEPIPATEKIITAPYAKVNRKGNNKSDNVELKNEKPENDDGNGQSIAADLNEPPEEVFEKYKNEPLPELPKQTLYEQSKEWSNSVDLGYENCKSSLPEMMEDHKQYESMSRGRSEIRTQIAAEGKHQASQGAEHDQAESLKHETVTVEIDTKEEKIEKKVDSESHSLKGSDAGGDTEGKVAIKGDASVKGGPAKGGEAGGAVSNGVDDYGADTDEGDAQTFPKINVPLPALPDVEEPELDFGNERQKIDVTESRNLKSPVFVKVTNIQTQVSIEGALEVERALTRDSRFKSLSGERKLERNQDNRERSKSDIFPNSKADEGGIPWSSQTARRNKQNEVEFDTRTATTLPNNMLSPSTTVQTPKHVDVSAARKIVDSESVYTPLLGETRESNTSSLSGVGAAVFETDMALSTSLAREKVTKQSMQGQYARLISVANRDDESRRELLMKPMYIVSVGSGYLDLRKRPKLGSGLDFFTKLTASEPEPKLLIWKVSS